MDATEIFDFLLGERPLNGTLNHSSIISFSEIGDSVNNATDASRSNEEEKRCFSLSRFYIQSVIAGVLCASGIITNAFSIAVLSRDRETSPISSLLLRSLAAIDIFFLSSWITVWTILHTFEVFGNLYSYHLIYHYLRIYVYQLLFVGQTATIWTTVLIAATRFIAVSLPYYAPNFCTLRSTRIRLVAILIFSFIYNIPRCFEFRIRTDFKPNERPYELTAIGQSNTYKMIYLDICYYIFTFILPFLFLTTFNLRLIVDYRRINRKRNSMLSTGRTFAREKHEQNITLIMIIVIVVFVICNFPARILQVVILSFANQRCPSLMFFLIEFTSVLEVLSSTLNFFIYFFCRTQFRYILRRELCTVSYGNRSSSSIKLPLRCAPCPSRLKHIFRTHPQPTLR